MKRKGLIKACIIGIAFILLTGCANNTQPKAENQSETSADEVKAVSQAFVDVSAGTLMGYKEGNVYNFKGIPYATAERFKNPTPITSYDNNFHSALTYGEVSPQDRTLASTGHVNPYEFFTPSNGTADMVGNENCQYLNVWTNNLKEDKPVIVFFHGGGLNNGASSELSFYTGESFADTNDAVFVSVNTRLNVLGFLDLSAYDKKYADSGLVGMEDAVVALRWVQDNIAHFGGNPKNVTIVGQSGGGDKVTTLACMSDARGLFDKVAVLSGYYSTSSKQEGVNNTKLLVDYLKLKDDEVIDRLKSMDYEDLLKAATAAGCNWETRYGDGTFTAPLFEPGTGKMNEYAAQRTWMWGTTYSEFNGNMPNLAYGNQKSSHFPDYDDNDALNLLKERYGDQAQAIADEYKKAYPTHRLIESLYLSTPGMISRYALISPKDGILKKFTDAGVTVYNYVSAYSEPIFGGVTMTHSGDIPYWFNSIEEAPYFIRGDEVNAHKVEKTMSQTLYSFMKDGNPSTDELAWKPYTANNHSTMVFDVESNEKKDYDAKLYELITNSAK
ncbi:LOW QUALITY PROTEIN: Carboxylesterase type B [Clostridium sp. DL-VIII]|nr:LOW QUALITY PROTEIN: Carboxylesterase type B [Clostridium sp. DL-VIII]